MTIKITEMNRKTCTLIREAVEENLAEIMDELGLTLETQNGSYDHNKFSLKVRFVLAGADPAREEFEQWANIYGVKPEDYGMGITIGRERYKLTGINIKARRYPFNVERLRDGKKYKFPQHSIVQALGRKSKPPIFKGEVETI